LTTDHELLEGKAAARLIFVFCLAEVFSMASFATFPALLPTFVTEWGLSATEAGWISGIYYAGYTVAVPVLTSLTDRVDPRRIYLASTLLTALAALGYAYLAEGFWSAMLWRALTGVGLAGTYMPGLKALSDRVSGAAQSRAVSFYTASFGIGASISFLMAGEIATRLDWRWACSLGALGSAVSLVIMAWVLKPRPPSREEGTHESHFLDFRPVFRNFRAMGFVWAYTAHNFELFGFRSWIVAFLVFSQALQPGAESLLSATAIAAIFNLFGWPASILGNEAAVRFGRQRTITIVMTASALYACGFGFSASLPYLVVIALGAAYAVTVTGDSSAITAGAVAAARPDQRGATMAVHSTLGFSGAFAGPVVFGWVLDLAGGPASQNAWGVAFASMGAVLILGPIALAICSRAAAVRETSEQF
jgi:MFS family permease